MTATIEKCEFRRAENGETYLHFLLSGQDKAVRNIADNLAKRRFSDCRIEDPDPMLQSTDLEIDFGPLSNSVVKNDDGKSPIYSTQDPNTAYRYFKALSEYTKQPNDPPAISFSGNLSISSPAITFAPKGPVMNVDYALGCRLRTENNVIKEGFLDFAAPTANMAILSAVKHYVSKWNISVQNLDFRPTQRSDEKMMARMTLQLTNELGQPITLTRTQTIGLKQEIDAAILAQFNIKDLSPSNGLV